MKVVLSLIILAIFSYCSTQVTGKMNSSTDNVIEQYDSTVFTHISKSNTVEIKIDSSDLRLPVSHINITMYNNTDTTCLTGKEYVVQYYDTTQMTWNDIRLNNNTWEAIGYTIPPYSFHIFKIRLATKHFKYEKGKYRIIKPAVLNHQKINPSCVFEIK